MRKLTLVLILGLVVGLAVPSVTPAHATTCSPHGYVVIGPDRGSYDWIANGEPTDSSCWSTSYGAASVVTGSTCGSPMKAWEFTAWNTDLEQAFTIPTTMTASHFGIEYLLDFDDPNNDGAWNQFSMTVTDSTTGAQLASERYFGTYADLYCSNRESLWTGNLAGHTIVVRFVGSRSYPDTHIRIRGIALFQSY